MSKSRQRGTISQPSFQPHSQYSQPQKSTFMDAVKDGIAFSIGSNLVERAISSVIPRTVVHQHESSPDCNEINRIYKEQFNPSSTLEEAFNKCKK